MLSVMVDQNVHAAQRQHVVLVVQMITTTA